MNTKIEVIREICNSFSKGNCNHHRKGGMQDKKCNPRSCPFNVSEQTDGTLVHPGDFVRVFNDDYPKGLETVVERVDDDEFWFMGKNAPELSKACLFQMESLMLEKK